MPTTIHEFSQEQMMAYLDGELSGERAAEAARHLDDCSECRALAADFREMSQKLRMWHVEPLAPRMPQVAPARQRQVFWRRPWIVTVVAAGVIVAVGVNLRTVRPTAAPASNAPVSNTNVGWESRGLYQRTDASGRASEHASVMQLPNMAATTPNGPLIVRTAQLGVISKTFERCRSEVERVVNAHHGYIAQLEFSAPNGAGRNLNAGLRIPASELDPLLMELRHLGTVSSESQRGEDVSQHYVDVNARLANLRMTESRLQDILRNRTGALADVLQVEEAVDRTRGEIETTEAEQKALTNRIAFATVELSISEEYEKPLQGNDHSALSQLHNAAVEGYRNVVEGTMVLLTLLLSAGPALAIVLAIGYFPALWWWRRRISR